MPRIHVSALSRIADVARATGARSMVTLINPDYPVARPPDIAPERHLRLSLADIDIPVDDHVAPEARHVRELLAFARAWDRRAPLLIHCYAGVSRSTAAAMIVVAALAPSRDEHEIAQTLRAASPSATPNKLLIRHADALLARGGRLVAAAMGIGRGADCYEGEPFAMELE
jgi:predicted protein tyrosine phosphatase